MRQDTRQSMLIVALLALSLAGCQKNEEPPAPQTQAPENATPAMPAPGQENSPAPQPNQPPPGGSGGDVQPNSAP